MANTAHAAPADGLCANCSAPLLGAWCHGCGQRAADHHRSLLHLGHELIEGLTHADGRLWRTLRLLALHPGVLTRSYLAGRRAAVIPPLRLFFVMLLLVFAFHGAILKPGDHTFDMTAADRANADAHIEKLSFGNTPRLDRFARRQVERALADPHALIERVNDWAERFAVLLLPLTAISLRLLFPFRRDATLYDNAIFAMHSLSFAGFVWVAFVVLRRAVPHPAILTGWLLVLPPIHLFAHLRGVYKTSILGTLLRAILLGGMTLGIVIFLAAALSLFSLSTLGTNG